MRPSTSESVAAAAVLAQIVGCESERPPDFGFIGVSNPAGITPRRTWGRHPYRGAAHHVGVAGKDTPPQPVAEDDFVIPPRLGFFGQEGAADEWLRAQHREQAGRNRGPRLAAGCL